MKLDLRGEHAREQVTVVFRNTSDWLRKWRDIFLTNHKSQKIPNNPKSTIDTSLKTNQNSALSLTRKLKKKKKNETLYHSCAYTCFMLRRFLKVDMSSKYEVGVT